MDPMKMDDDWGYPYDLGVFPDLPCDRAWLRVFRQACPRKVFELDIEDTIQVSLVVVPLKGENMA